MDKCILETSKAMASIPVFIFEILINLELLNLQFSWFIMCSADLKIKVIIHF
jgi:hypothetical protein